MRGPNLIYFIVRMCLLIQNFQDFSSIVPSVLQSRSCAQERLQRPQTRIQYVLGAATCSLGTVVYREAVIFYVISAILIKLDLLRFICPPLHHRTI